MKKTIAILAVSTICGMTNGQSLTTNAQKDPQLKMIAEKLNSITTYQAHCDLVTTDPSSRAIASRGQDSGNNKL